MDQGTSIEPEVVFGQIYPFISDPEIEEIWINTPEQVFIAKQGKNQITTMLLTTSEIHDLVERMLLWSGRRLDLSSPFVDARLPDGSRLHVVIPEITSEHWAVNIRKHTSRHKSLRDLAVMGVMNQEVNEILSLAVRKGFNILVSGATQAGKTTLLNALASEIPLNQRLITIEEVFELKPRIPDLVQMQTRSRNLQDRGEITLRRLVKEALRMRPSRIIIGEVREAEALDLLIALNSGLPGMGTIHANSAYEAITKLQTLPLLAGENISHDFIAPTVASAIDLVIHVDMNSEGLRRVSEVLFLSGRCEGRTVVTERVFVRSGKSFRKDLGYQSLIEALNAHDDSRAVD